jgi:hypothetical protein
LLYHPNKQTRPWNINLLVADYMVNNENTEMATPTEDTSTQQAVPTPSSLRAEIKAIFKRIAALHKELKERNRRLEYLYGFEMRPAPPTSAPRDNTSRAKEAKGTESNDSEQDVGEQEDEAKKIDDEKTAVKKTAVKKTAVKKTAAKKGGSKKTRLCKQCENKYLEDDAPSTWVNCKDCRAGNTKEWNERRANKWQKKLKEREARQSEQQGEEVGGNEVEDEDTHGDMEGDMEKEDLEEQEEQRKQPKHKSAMAASK